MDAQTSAGTPLWMRRRLLYGFARPEELQTNSMRQNEHPAMHAQDRQESNCMSSQDSCRTGCAQVIRKLVKF